MFITLSKTQQTNPLRLPRLKHNELVRFVLDVQDKSIVSVKMTNICHVMLVCVMQFELKLAALHSGHKVGL